MKLLVTGATGLLGNNIVRRLLSEGHEARVLTRSGSDSRPLAGLDVEYVQGDVRQADVVRQACQGVDGVIHCAAHVHIGWTQIELHREINVEGTRSVARSAREGGARMVYVSSINALGLGRLESPADEESPLPGIVRCPYVVSKQQAEEVVLEECGRGLHGVIVNPSLMFGPWDWKPSSGQMMLEVVRGAPLAPRGAANFCDVRDVAAGCIAALQKGKVGRRYVLGAHNETYFDLWQRMARVAGVAGPKFRMGPIVRICGSMGGDLWACLTGREGVVNSAMVRLSAQEHCFSSARAQAELGYTIRPLDESLEDAWNWFIEHGYAQRRRAAG
jgi:dihydroflavonol-4-reductase